jgi:hypothetical protein
MIPHYPISTFLYEEDDGPEKFFSRSRKWWLVAGGWWLVGGY